MIEYTWKSLRLGFMAHRYGETAKRWKDETRDDRLVFVNMYNKMVRALETLPDEPDNYLCVAIDEKITRDWKTLDEIMTVFAGR